jgi:iron complex transport system ATP-binding protein
MMISLRGVTRVDDGRTRLKETTLEVHPASVTTIVGPNGAGKSTLLSVMAGELDPTEGEVWIADRPLTDYVPMELARTRALMAQNTQTTFAFRVRDIVSWGRYCWRSTPQALSDDERIDHALTDQGIIGLADRPVTQLSGGERARTHLARVLAQDSSIVFLDEADADLDLAGRAHLDEVILRLRDAGRTVVVVSHDLARAVQVSDFILAVQSGDVFRHGPTREVLTVETVSEVFGVSRQVAERSL